MTDSCFNRVADLEKDSDVSECFRIAILLFWKSFEEEYCVFNVAATRGVL